MNSYASVKDIKKIGPCLVPDHEQEHELGPKCWQAMRHFLWNNNDNFAAYVEAVKRK